MWGERRLSAVSVVVVVVCAHLEQVMGTRFGEAGRQAVIINSIIWSFARHSIGGEYAAELRFIPSVLLTLSAVLSCPDKWIDKRRRRRSQTHFLFIRTIPTKQLMIWWCFPYYYRWTECKEIIKYQGRFESLKVSLVFKESFFSNIFVRLFVIPFWVFTYFHTLGLKIMLSCLGLN